MTRLRGFAYGESLEGLPPRSLGYRLLTPCEPEPWCQEVEALARRLQAAPYPEHWPPAELFCSALLSDGRRLVAVARYGLADHTASPRRGGLELFGVVGPGSLGVPSAQAVYHWLRRRRAANDDLRQLQGDYLLDEILTAVPPAAAPAPAVSVLPIRIWQEGVLLFAATAPTDPDQRLGLLEQGQAGNWQWLPFVGADFPWNQYAARGPLIAWTPHLSGVAVKLEQPAAAPAPPSQRPLILIGILLIAALLAGNLWVMQTLPGRVASREPVPVTVPQPQPAAPDESVERFARGLRRLLTEPRRSAADPDLNVQGHDAREVVALVERLAHQGKADVPKQVRDALLARGWDSKLVDVICSRVQEAIDSGTR